MTHDKLFIFIWNPHGDVKEDEELLLLLWPRCNNVLPPADDSAIVDAFNSARRRIYKLIMMNLLIR